MAARAAALLSTALLMALGCVQDDGSRFNPVRDMVTVDDDEERELGLQFDQEIRKHVRVIEDPVVAGFIHDLGQELVRTIEPQPFVYRFRVIDDPALNAFAVPGGYVYFHSGTVLAAAGVDELAGVMGHEIAHVKAHHYARMRQQSQIPDLIAGIAGLAAAIATREPGLLVASQAANVAVKLRFSREFEAEADQLGAIFVTRGGFDPAGISRFFERILEEQKRHPYEIPPYLFSHPAVDDRIEAVKRDAKALRPTRAPDPRFADRLPDVQARLAYLVETGRDSVPPPGTPADTTRTDPLLAEAENLLQEGGADEALVLLARAESLEPRDPRVPFRVGEVLAFRGRHAEAVEAYRRVIALDPTRALVFYKLGLSHQALGERHSAVQAYEQAASRAGVASALRRRADWRIETLVFPVFLERGFAAATEDVGQAGDELPAGVGQVTWWARLHPRYQAWPERMRIRWIDPAGRPVGETALAARPRPFVASQLAIEPPGTLTAGGWTAEVIFEDDVLERHAFRVAQPPR